MFSAQKYFKSPATGKFAGSPASLLLVSALAVYCAIVSLHGGLASASPRTGTLLAGIFFAIGGGALCLAWAAWKKHRDKPPPG
jgi:hypothetical protein